MARAWSRRVRRLPGDDGACGWIEALPPPPPPRRLHGSEKADCVVVGAGSTGVAAARRLAELRPDWRIVLLDARRAGEGATARSSGFLVTLAHFVARMEPEAARRWVRLSRWGIAGLREIAAQHAAGPAPGASGCAPDCAWDESGWLHAAAGAPAAQALDGFAAWLDGVGERYERLDDAAMRATTGTGYYRAGIRLPGSVLVQPAALFRGLLAGLPESVDLYEETPVVRLRRERGGFAVEAGDGEIAAADRLFLATNGYLPSLGFLGRRLFPLWTFGSLTRVLTPTERAALGGEREWGLLAGEPLGATVRRTRDQRLLFRSMVRYQGAAPAPARLRERARAVHRRALLDRYPRLAALEFETTWGGVMGMTANRHHAFGALADRLYAAGGYSGCGLVMAAVAGRLLADLALGVESEELADMLALPPPPALPPQPFLGLGVRARLAMHELAALGRT